MKYKYIMDDVVARIDDDGLSRMSCATTHPDYLEWLAQGNMPEPADPPTAAELNAPILDELAALDVQRVRPLAEIALAQVAGEPLPLYAKAKLADIEAKAKVLRAQLIKE